MKNAATNLVIKIFNKVSQQKKGIALFSALTLALSAGAAKKAAPATETQDPELAPVVSQVFAPIAMKTGEASTLTLTLANPAEKSSRLTAPFMISLPTGLQLTSVTAVNTTCGGELTTNTAGTKVVLAKAQIPAKGSCVLVLKVTAPASGSYLNTVLAGGLQTTFGSNVNPAVAGLAVSMPAAPKVVRTLNPVISKTNEFITMNISITNPNSTDAVLTAPFTDVLPKGMVVVGRANTTCGGKLTAVNGSSKITLENAKIPAYSACLIMVGVTAVYPGTYEVRTAAGILQTSKGNNVAVAEPVKVTVSGLPPAELKLSKSFNPAVISANEFVTMSISISNPNGTDALLTEAFNDTLPKGMMILGNTSTSCGGKLTAVPGSSKVTLTDARIPAYGACQILLGVTASAEGSYENKVVAGMLQTDKGKNSEQEAAILKVH